MRCMEKVTWKLTLPEVSAWLRKLKQGLCINLEEWGGQGDGREVQKGGDIGIPMTDSCWGLTENNRVL